ncbi:hypothetical protein CHUAL_002182 [Chamberlinius hualienensis]
MEYKVSGSYLIIMTFVYFASPSKADIWSSCGWNRGYCYDGLKFFYTKGFTYNYKYSANIASDIVGSSSDFSGLFIEADVQLHAITSCHFSMSLKEISIHSRTSENPAPTEQAVGHELFKTSMEANPIHFQFNDGAIDSLCSHPRDEPWVLNVKRGIISMLQNNAVDNLVGGNLIERDVLGDCPTNYVMNYYLSTSLVVNKTKDLNGCRQRGRIISSLQSTPYADLIYQDEAVIKSSYVCIQHVNNTIISKVDCKEKYVSTLFANGQNGVSFQSQQNLIFTQFNKAKFTHSQTQFLKTTLLFDYDYTDKLNEINNANEILKHICSDKTLTQERKTPKLFYNLVRILSTFDLQQLTNFVTSSIQMCHGVDAISDILPMIETESSLTLMTQMILDNAVSETMQNQWLRWIALTKKATSEMLTAVLPLVLEIEPSSQAMLSVSALADLVCSKRANCTGEIKPARDLLQFLENKLLLQCEIGDTTPISEVIVTLKSVGNFGQFSNTLLTALEKCSSLLYHKTGLRVEAIEAYRKLPCSIPKPHLMAMFELKDEENEVRLASYLQLIRCADRSTLEKILKIVQDSSGSKQVKSFVFSHLKSLQETADPCKKHLSLLLEELVDFEDLQSEEKDIRKFSRFYGKSLYSEQLQLGGNVQGYVIYSSNSFLPRSMGLNFTVDLFGHSINLLQLSTRAQGLDFLAENIFRPEPQYQPAESSGKELTKNINKNGKNKVIVLPMEGLMSAKIFGQDIWTMGVDQKKISDFMSDMSTKRWTDFLQFLSEHNSATFQKNIILFDTAQIRSSSTGFPLILSLNSTASVHLKAGGRINLGVGRRDVEGKLKQSSTVIAETAMTLNGYIGQLSTRLITEFHTSIIIDGQIEYKAGENTKIRLNVPEEKVDLIDLSNKVVIRKWDKDEEFKSSLNVNQHWGGCTGMELEIGMQICGQISYPNASSFPTAPYFPLNGPMVFSLTLAKTDKSIKHYLLQHLQREKDYSDKKSSYSLLLSVNTPNSVIDREWTVHYSLDSSDGSLNFRLISPMKKLEVGGFYKTIERRKQLSVRIDVDKQQTYNLESDLRYDFKNEMISFTPKISLKTSSSVNLLTLEGHANYVPNRKLEIDLHIEDVTIRPVIIKALLSQNRADQKESEFCYDIKFNSPMIDANSNGTLKTVGGSGLTLKTVVEYQLEGKGPKEIIEIIGKTRLSRITLTTATADLVIHTSALAIRDASVQWELQLAEGYIEQTLIVNNLKKQNIFWAQHLFSYGGTLDNNHLNARAEAKWSQVHFYINVTHTNTAASFASHVHLQPSRAGQFYCFEAGVDHESDITTNFASYAKLQMDLQEYLIALNITENFVGNYLIKWQSAGEPIPTINATLIYLNNNSLMAFDQSFSLDAESRYSWSKLKVNASLYLSEDNGQLSINTEGHHTIVAYYERVDYNIYSGRLMVDTVANKGLINGIGRIIYENNIVREEFSGMFNSNVIWMAENKQQRRNITIAGNWRDSYELMQTNFDVLWDSENDLNKHVEISTFIFQQSNASTTKFKMSYLRKEILIEFFHNFRGVWFKSFSLISHCLLQWDGLKRLGIDARIYQNKHPSANAFNGSLELYTPLVFLEEISLSGSHQDNNSSWKTNGSLLINNKWDFTMSSFGKDWKSGNQRHFIMTTNVTTPYKGVESVCFSVDHSVASREIKTVSRFDWGEPLTGNKIELIINVIRPDALYRQGLALFSLTTPFQGLKTGKFVLQHDLTQNGIDTWTTIEWNKVTVVYCGLHGLKVVNKDGYYYLNGNVTIVIPVDGLRNVSCVLKHKYGPDLLSTELSSNWAADKKARIFIHGSKEQSGIDGKFDVILPSTSFGMSANYGRENESKITGNLKGHWNGAVSELQLDGNYIGITRFYYRFQLNTPLNEMNEVVFSITNLIDGASVNSSIMGRIGKTKAEVAVEGVLNRGGYSNGHFKCNTPWKAFPNVLIDVYHGPLPSEIFVTGIDGQWNNSTFNVNHSILFHGWTRFLDKIDVSLPFDGLKNCSLVVDHLIADQTINDLFRIEAANSTLLSLDFKGSFGAKSKLKRALNSKLKVDTTIWTPHGIEIVFNHEDDDVNFKPRLTIHTTDPAKQVLDISVSLASFSGGKALNVTLANVGYFEAEIKVEGKEIEFKSKTNWRNLIVSGLFGIDFLAPRMMLDINQENAVSFKMDGAYDVWGAEKVAYFFIQKGDWKITVNGSGVFAVDNMNGGVVIDITPSPGFEILLLNISAVNSESSSNLNKNLKVSLKWMNTNILSVSIGAQTQRQSTTRLIAAVTTPVSWLKVADFTMSIDKGEAIEMMVRWNREHRVELIMSSVDVFNTTWTLQSTHSSLPYVKLMLLSKLDPNHKQIMTYLEVDQVKKRAYMDLKQSNRSVDIVLELDTPDSYSLNGNWQTGTANALKATIKTPEQQLHLVGNMRVTKEASSAKGNLNVNGKNIGKLNFSKNKRGPLIEIAFDVDKAIGHFKGKRFYFAQSDEKNAAKFEASMTTESGNFHEILVTSVKIPSPRTILKINSLYLGSRSPLTFETGLKVRNRPLEVNGDIILHLGNMGKHEADFQINANNLNFVSVTFNANSPLLTTNEIKSYLNFKDTDKGLEAMLGIKLPSGNNTLIVTYEKNLIEGSTTILVNSDVSIIDPGVIRIIGKHKGHEWDNMAVEFELTTPIEGYETFKTSVSTVHEFGSAFKLDVHVVTPYVGYEDIIFVQFLNYSLKQLDIELQTRYRFDELGVNIDGSCKPENGGLIVNSDVRWWSLSSKMPQNSVNFTVSTNPVVIELKSSGNRWNLSGNGHYKGWSDLNAKLDVISTKNLHLNIVNNLKHLSRNHFMSYVVLDYGNKTLFGITVGGEQRGNVYFNITTPFSVVQKISGIGTVLRDKGQFKTDAKLAVNDDPLFNGSLLWLSDEVNRNRTAVFELDNQWQPIGIHVKTHRRLTVWEADARVIWNFAKREQSCAGAVVQVNTTASGRDLIVTLIHPQHKGQLKGGLHKSNNSFTHVADINWADKKIAAYRITSLWTYEDDENIWKKDVKFKWEHPGRVALVDGVVFKTKTDVIQLQSALKLNEQNEGLQIGAECTKSRVAVVIRHPKLAKVIDLEAEVFAPEVGTKILDGKLSYSSDPREDLKLKIATFKFGIEGHVMMVHHASHLDLATYWYTDKLTTANLSVHYDDHRVIIEGRNGLNKQIGSFYVLYGTERQLHDLISIVALRNDPRNMSVLLRSSSVIVDFNTLLNNPYITAVSNRNGSNSPTLLKAGLDPSLKRFVFETDNFGDGLDAKIVFHLNTTRMFTGRAYWVPGIGNRVKDTLMNEIMNFHQRTMQWSGKIWNKAATELITKWNQIFSGIIVTCQPLSQEIKQAVDEIIEDFTSIREELLKMYYNNDFFIQDIWPTVESLYQYLEEYFVNVWHRLSSSDVNQLIHNIGIYLISFIDSGWNQWLNLTANILNEIWRSFFDLSNEAVELLNRIYDKIATLISAIPDIAAYWMSNISASNSRLMSSLSSLMALGERFKDLFNGLIESIIKLKDWIFNLISNVKDWLTSNTIYKFLRNDLLNYIKESIVSVYNWAARLLSSWIQLCRKYMAEEPKKLLDEFLSVTIQIRDRLWKLLIYDINTIATEYITEAFKTLYSKFVWLVYYYDLWPHGYLTIYNWYTYWNDLFTTSTEVSSDRFYSSNYFLVSPENGQIELDQQLPFPWRHFKLNPAIRQTKEVQSFLWLWSMFRTAGKADGMSMMTKYYQLMEFSLWSWLPPFTGQALVAGRRLYVSFDGRVTEFSGSCSYILAKDLLDGNFSVIMNYENRTNSKGEYLGWSIEVQVDESKVTMLPDYRVAVDGRKSDLPVVFGYTSIMREENKVILNYQYGLQVTCYWSFDMCTVKVAGWYFGRMGGLLGTYNYELWDDKMTAEKALTENNLSWGKSWAVGTCHSKSNVPSYPTKNSTFDERCKNLFNSTTSMFRYCYSKVPPEDFMNICLYDVSQSSSPYAMCSSAAAYVTTCQSIGVPIRMNKQCVRCTSVDGSVIEEGGNVTLNASLVKSTDVVFLVEAKKCNRGLLGVFDELLMDLDVALQEVKVIKRRFAVIVFGGSEPLDSPHVYVSDNEVFSDQWHSVSIKLKIGRGHADVFDALTYASKLPFSPGASKTFVVAACSSGELMEMRSDYPEVHRMLLEDGVNLHLLLDRDFGLKKIYEIYGIDGVAAYTSKDSHSSSMIGDEDLRRQIIPPKDIHVPIALETDGSVFSSLYLSLKKNKKLFIDVFSRRVAQSSQKDVCHSCDCLPDEDGVGQLYCQPCIFPSPGHVPKDPNDYFDEQHRSIYEQFSQKSPYDIAEEQEERFREEEEEERKLNRPQYY